MKRIVCLFLTLIFLIVSFGACDKPAEKVTITVLIEKNYEHSADNLAEVVEYLYPEITLEYITLPMEGVEREASLQNVRTEIMAGEGPDMFILSTWNQDDITWDSSNGIEYPRIEPLFKSVEDAMNNAIFLVLDQYIEESEYIDLENHSKPIMDAGRNELGQVVLPLHYTVPMFLADKQYLDDSDEILLNEAYFENCENEALMYTVQNFLMESWFAYQFTDYEDDNNNLILKVEELESAFAVAEKVFDAPTGGMSTVFYGFEDDYTSHYFNEMMIYSLHSNKGEYIPVWLENAEGGVTALVESYAAINNNSNHPEETFKVLEILFRDEVQSGSGIAIGNTDNGTQFKKYIDMEIENLNKKRGILTGKAAFSNENMYDYSDIEYINSRITHVRFTSEYDVLLTDAWRELNLTYYWQSKERPLDYDAMAEALYSELYSDFKMIAAE